MTAVTTRITAGAGKDSWQ